MKEQIVQLIEAGIGRLVEEGLLAVEQCPDIRIERTREKQHGDFACNIAMLLARQAGKSPRELAALIVPRIPESDMVDRIEIAGPGFINFYINDTAQHEIIEQIIRQGDTFGHGTAGANKKILIEFVSANPTGPLHVGHGRGAAYGATVANLLETMGYQVDREYYVNDAGRQMDILAVSVYIRYLQLCGVDMQLPGQCYQGGYINDIARDLHATHEKSLVHDIKPAGTSDDPEQALDILIQATKQTLGAAYEQVHALALNTILEQIKDDLAAFGVSFDQWYSEQSLEQNHKVREVIERLGSNGYIYENGGARWFRSEQLGDEKDRVVVRDNGVTTYFASDIAYHDDKFRRGYDRIIDIWGADHHGYIARVRAALQALGHDPERMDVLLVQFVSLFRGKEKIQMSTRSGQFVTLEELRNEVGRDATRFFYVLRKSEQHLDFDLDLAKSSTKDNPVYYIQYAHARISRLLEKLQADNGNFEITETFAYINELKESAEINLIGKLSEYPEVLESAATGYEPHQLVYYLKDLATEFHTYYDTCRVLDQPDPVKMARMGLCLAVKQIINNGLTLLGVSAPESM